MMGLDQSSPVSRDETQNVGGIAHAEFAIFNSKRLQSDLEAMSNKIKQHEDNFKFLKAQKNKLDEAIIDLQVHLSKLHSSPTSRSENCDTNLQGEDINEQILCHENSAAGVLGLVETRHGLQASQLMLSKGVVGVVAKLGKVNDENLSQILSNYLGTRSMLAVVCKSYDNVTALETYDNQGIIDRNAGLHGLGASIGRTIRDNFDAICLENLRPYVGRHIADDPQRRLDLLKPKLPNGECPPGFLGFAVNMIQIDPAYLLCVTSYGYGLRETLFYSLFSRLQVYKTRVDMISALPCISDGAISLDGGIIRTPGIINLGNRDEVNLRFAKPFASCTMDNFSETEKKMKELQWKKDKTLEDIKREQVLREQAVFNFGKKKEEFVRCLVQSSSINQMTSCDNSPVLEDNDDINTSRPSQSGEKEKRRETYDNGEEKSKRKTRSWVWDHFSRKSDNYDKCSCNYCGKELTCPTSSGTSNMKNHLGGCKQFKMASCDSSPILENNDDVNTSRPSQSGAKEKRRETYDNGEEKSKKKTRSWVWDHFSRKSDNYDKCSCNYCEKELTSPTSWGTSNLKNHLRGCKQFNVLLSSSTQQTMLNPRADGLRSGKAGEKELRSRT